MQVNNQQNIGFGYVKINSGMKKKALTFLKTHCSDNAHLIKIGESKDFVRFAAPKNVNNPSLLEATWHAALHVGEFNPALTGKSKDVSGMVKSTLQRVFRDRLHPPDPAIINLLPQSRKL